MEGIEVPSEWSSSKRAAVAQVDKKGRTVVASTAAAAGETILLSQEGSPFPMQCTQVTPLLACTEKASLREQMLLTLHAAEEQKEQEEEDDDECMESLEVDSLLSRLPYKKMMADLFGDGLGSTLLAPHLQYITRAYEESFMREKMHASERLCAKGNACECMHIDKANPFIAVEFLLPAEQPPATPHMCVLCCRATTQQLYYDIVYDKQEFHGCIQRYGNIHSQEGEYDLQAMLIMPPHAAPHIMPLPIVSHQRNRYKVHLHGGGLRCLQQTKVYFQSAPSQVA